MSTEEDYKKDPYCFFRAAAEFNDLVNSGYVGPWYFCKIIPIARWGDDEEFLSLSNLGFKIAKWWLENKEEESGVINLQDEGNFLVFDDEKLANQFKKWYDNQETINHLSTKLWLDRYDFHDEIAKTGKAHIEQKINMKELFEQYDDRILTEEIFDIYCWMEDNLGKIYYWDSDLYFSNEKDAVAFKLKWM